MGLPAWSEGNFRSNSGEDHLSILSVGVNIAENLLPGINTVTPRSRYHSFYCWVLLDFLENSQDNSRDAFKVYLRRREMAYILANLAALKPGEFTYSLTGVTKGEQLLNTGAEILNVNQSYVANEYGGYAIYRGVMQTMHLIKSQDNPALVDGILPKGRELAEAFIECIRETEYYKHYLANDHIPKNVLKKYGEIAGLDHLTGQADRTVLLDTFIRPDITDKRQEIQRRETFAFLLHAIEGKSDNKWDTAKAWRTFLLCNRFLDSTEYQGLAELSFSQRGWKVYQIRQYYAYALEAIFCHLIETVHLESKSVDAFISSILENTQIKIGPITVDFEIDLSLEEMINKLPPIRLEEAYAVVNNKRFDTLDHKSHFVTPIMMIFTVFNHVKALGDDIYSLGYAKVGGDNHLSMEKLVSDTEYLINKNATVGHFCTMLIDKYIIRQHHRVAMDKLLGYKLETYRLVENDGKLEFRNAYSANFNEFRGNQALTAMADLGLLTKNNGKFKITSAGKTVIQEVASLANLVKARNWGVEDAEEYEG